MIPRTKTVLSSTAFMEQGLTFDKRAHKFAFHNDLATFIEEGWFFYDKSEYLSTLLKQTGVSILTAPSGSGKTFFLRMIESFFAPYSKVGKDTFASLKVGRMIVENESIMNLYGTLPVVSIHMGRATHMDQLSNPDYFFRDLQDIVSECRNGYETLPLPQELFESEAYCKVNEGSYEATPDKCGQALKEFIDLICKHYGKKAIVLVDDYDLPYVFSHTEHRQAALQYTSAFYRAFLQDNDNIQHALLIGQLHVPYRLTYNHFSYTNPEWRGWFGVTIDEAKIVFTRQSAEELAVLNQEAGGYGEERNTIDLNSVVNYIMDWSIEDPDNESGYQNNFLYHHRLANEIFETVLSFRKGHTTCLSGRRVNVSIGTRLQCLSQLNYLLEHREGIEVENFDPCQPIDLVAFDQGTNLLLAALIQLGLLGFHKNTREKIQIYVVNDQSKKCLENESDNTLTKYAVKSVMMLFNRKEHPFNLLSRDTAIKICQHVDDKQSIPTLHKMVHK